MQLFISHIFTILIPFLLSLTLIIFKKWNKTPNKNHPPSLPKLPIIGNLHQIGLRPPRALRALSKKHGDIILLHFGTKPTIIISSREIASQILKTHDLVFAGRPRLRLFRKLLGNGNDIISSPYSEKWRHLKSLCVVQLLGKKKVGSYGGIREDLVDQILVKEIERQDGLLMNLSEMFTSLSNRLVCRVALGKECVGVEFEEVLEEYQRLVGGYYVGDFVSWLGWIDVISGVDGRVRRAAELFDGFLESVIEEHGNDGDGGEGVKDFVDVLLGIQRDGDEGMFGLDKDSIKGVILDMFVAGAEGIKLALEWTMSELIKNPRVMNELLKEIRSIVGDKKTVSETDLHNMNYLKAVLKESLRLHSPVPLLAPHECTENSRINGYDIYAGTLVIVNAWSINRDPRYWEEAECFYPERFLNSSIDFKGNDFEYIPFGSGRRMCPGTMFATSIIELVIANLVHRFDWSLPDGAEINLTEGPGVILHKQHPLLLVASISKG